MEYRAQKSTGKDHIALQESVNNHIKNHDEWLQQAIYDKRNSSAFFQKHDQENSEELSSSCVSESPSIINIDQIKASALFLRTDQSVDKNNTKRHLKLLRKELSKPNISPEILSSLIENNEFFSVLVNFLFDFKNSEIQLEALWILNNLCIYYYQFQQKEKLYEIHNFLTKFMISENNFSNVGIKNLILEKFFSLIGNLILYDENVYFHYINNHLLQYLVKNLNSSVRSLRTICLWTINNIINATNCLGMKRNNQISNITDDTNIISTNKIMKSTLFYNESMAYYYKFVFSRLDYNKNFDESYEFLWLIYYLVNENSELGFNILFNMNSIPNDNDNFNKLLKFVVVDRLSQPIIRIIGTLITEDFVLNVEIKRKIVEAVLDNTEIGMLLNSTIKYCTINTDKVGFVNDVVWFINSLAFYDPIKTCQLFKASLEYLANPDITVMIQFPLETVRNLLTAIYLCYSAEGLNDIKESVISLVLNNTEQLSCDLRLRYIILDFLYVFLKSTHKLFNKVEYLFSNDR